VCGLYVGACVHVPKKKKVVLHQHSGGKEDINQETKKNTQGKPPVNKIQKKVYEKLSSGESILLLECRLESGCLSESLPNPGLLRVV
jgi:hypothetical protein